MIIHCAGEYTVTWSLFGVNFVIPQQALNSIHHYSGMKIKVKEKH